MEFDILIRDGKIIDGTGSPWYKGDIGICLSFRKLKSNNFLR